MEYGHYNFFFYSEFERIGLQRFLCARIGFWILLCHTSLAIFLKRNLFLLFILFIFSRRPERKSSDLVAWWWCVCGWRWGWGGDRDERNMWLFSRFRRLGTIDFSAFFHSPCRISFSSSFSARKGCDWKIRRGDCAGCAQDSWFSDAIKCSHLVCLGNGRETRPPTPRRRKDEVHLFTCGNKVYTRSLYYHRLLRVGLYPRIDDVSKIK